MTPRIRRSPPRSTAAGGSARLTARRTSATRSIASASAPTTRIHASHGIAMAPHAMSAVERRDRVRERDLPEPIRQERDRSTDRLLMARDRERRVGIQEQAQPDEEQEPTDDAPAGPATGPPAQLRGRGARLRRQTVAPVLRVRGGLIDERAHEAD